MKTAAIINEEAGVRVVFKAETLEELLALVEAWERKESEK